jgi:hypothetical protein
MSQRLGVGLTVLNAGLLILLLAGQFRSVSARQDVQPVLRGRALEIVDEQGRVRAEILIHGPETVNGRRYPETVLFRMADPTSGPVVKLTAAANGSALGLSDDAHGGIQLYARDTASFVRVVDKQGRERIVRP